MKKHVTDGYIVNPTHKVTVNLIGCGGTGSQVLSGLACINMAIMGLGHPGLHVRVWDGDLVEESNVGRQLYSMADIGLNKAVVSVTRVNRYFGTAWEAVAKMYKSGLELEKHANIIISCVDTVAARLEIHKAVINAPAKGHPEWVVKYWMDFGNGKSTGQVVLGTVFNDELKNVIKLLPEITEMEDVNNGPSCSIAQALGKQDLFINSILAQMGLQLLWQLLREGHVRYNGVYVNLHTLETRGIKITE